MKTSREYIKKLAQEISDLSDRRAALLFCHLYNKTHETVAVQKQITVNEKNVETLLANMVFATKREIREEILQST